VVGGDGDRVVRRGWAPATLCIAALVTLVGAPAPQRGAPDGTAASAPAAPAPFVGPPAPWGPTRLLGQKVAVESKARLSLPAGESFAGSAIDIPVAVVRGAVAGPVLCLTAGVHGDELNGVEIVRQVFDLLEPAATEGMVIGLPVVNLHGFRSSSRYLPDRRDLNRYFPGAPHGSSASRIADAIFRLLVARCDMLVDFHTASFHRTNLPQIRADVTDPRTFDLARRFGAEIVIHNYGMVGTLRRSATAAGIPAITYEAGEPMRFEQAEIDAGVRGVLSLLASYRMIPPFDEPAPTPEIYRRSRWVRSNDGGIFLATHGVGDRVRRGEVLGYVVDPVTDERAELTASVGGRIVGMAVPQVVIPGFATFHLGIVEDTAEADVPGDPAEQLDALEQPEE
jgi:predicted deacylase